MDLMKKTFFTIFLTAGMFFVATSVVASTGFVDSPIWFTPESPQDGTMVTIYAVFRNSEKNTITGSVLFYDNDLLLGKKQIAIEPNNVGLSNVTFKIGAGNHSFSAQMTSLTESNGSGGNVPISISTATTKLPDYFVSKSIPNPFSAQASSGNSASEKLLLDQVDNLQKKVLDSVPSNVKESVATSTKSLDNWRESSAENFKENKESAQNKLNEISKVNDANSKNGKVSPASKYVDTPLAYVKLWFFSLLSFVFGTPVMFYIIGLLLVFFVLRFVFYKLVKLIKRKRNKISDD